MPWGGVKNRMHQCSSAVGRIQLRKYDAEKAEIDKAMKYFWKKLEGVNGISIIYPKDEGSDKAGWYATRFLYEPEAFHGISNATFAKALNAEVAGHGFSVGGNYPLHKSSVFYDVDIFGNGVPTASRFLPKGIDVKALTGELPVAAQINTKILGEPWFKHYEPEIIDKYVEAVLKVVEYHEELLAVNDTQKVSGGIGLSPSR